MAVLTITSLCKSYRAGLPGCSASVAVLRDVHLTVWERDIVALQGPPGSGKSTLLRCASGLLHPDAGTVSWFDGYPAPRDFVAYLAADVTGRSHAHASPRVVDGSLYARLVRARGARLLLVDDLPLVSEVERRLALAMLRAHAAAGASIILAANSRLAAEPVVTRALALTHGALTQRRKRSATRIAVSSFASRARASASSTYGRSVRSPQ